MKLRLVIPLFLLTSPLALNTSANPYLPKELWGNENYRR